MKVVGRLRRRKATNPEKKLTYIVYYITISKALESIDVIREAIERGWVNIRICGEPLTAPIREVAGTHYIHIPIWFIRKHPELEKTDKVEYEILENQ